jgi:hypothetical protein
MTGHDNRRSNPAGNKRRRPPTFRSPGFDGDTFSPAPAPIEPQPLNMVDQGLRRARTALRLNPIRWMSRGPATTRTASTAWFLSSL